MSQTGIVGTTPGIAASASVAGSNVTHAIGPTGNATQNMTASSLPSNAAAPSGGGGAFPSSSPGNP